MIDNNDIEIRAMDAFRRDDGEEGHRLQREFLEAVAQSGEDHCPCKVACRYHGRCRECVLIHRGHGDHLPDCLKPMVNRRIAALSALTEHSFRPGEEAPE